MSRRAIACLGAAFVMTGLVATEARANHCGDPTTNDVTLGVDDDVIAVSWDCHEDRADTTASEREPGTTHTVARRPTHYVYRTSYSNTQAACWRLEAGYDGAPDPSVGQYATRAAAAQAATSFYGPTTSGGGQLIGTDAADGVYRQQQMLPCVDEADEIQAAVVTPLQRALVGWQAWAQPLAPAVLTEPTTHSITGVPTIVSVDDYQPDYDIDDDPRTITWSLPGDTIQLRATADHRVRWNDEGGVTEWLSRNGRPFRDQDADDGFADPELIAHTYTVKGGRTIQVDVRWTGEWRNAGGAWEPLPAEPIYLVESFPLDVREIVAVGN